VDFVVVDAIVGMEKARVMGMNPDDMEFLTLSERRGMGVAQLSAIRIAGDSIDHVTRRFEKHPSDWGTNGEYGHYGQGVKTWLLKGPISFDDIADHPLDAARLPTPQPGLNGWGQPVYFHDDKIDLDRFFDDPVKSVTYGYTEFDAPRDQDAELWVGSDEGLRVWINGELVYHFAGSRRHRLPNERVPIRIRKGRSSCLVEASQKRGGYDFSLKICEPEEDPRYDGNTVFGLTYSVPVGATSEVQELPVATAHSRSEWWEEHTVDVTQPIDLRVDDLEVDPLTGEEGAIVELSAMLDSDGVIQRWRSAPGSSHVSERGQIVGEAPRALHRDESPPGHWDSPLGNWFCDAIRWTAGTDVAFQNNGGMRRPQIVDGQIRYVGQMGGRVVPEGEGRIREVDGAR
jgi:hypothetical protein